MPKFLQSILKGRCSFGGRDVLRQAFQQTRSDSNESGNSVEDGKGNKDDDTVDKLLTGSPALGGGTGAGGGGSIRSAGGALGKRAVAKEEYYFYRKTLDDLEKLHSEMEQALKNEEKASKDESEADKEVEGKIKGLHRDLEAIVDKDEEED